MIANTEPEPLIVLPPGQKKPEPVVSCSYQGIEFMHNGNRWGARREYDTETISLFTIKDYPGSNTRTHSLVAVIAPGHPLLQKFNSYSEFSAIVKYLIEHYSAQKYVEAS
jgi:hypothetical protein